jgi:hypothetical protein
LQKRAGALRSLKLIAKHARPVSRAGDPPSTVPAACVTASGARKERIEPPVGSSTPLSSATLMLTERLVPVSRSVANTFTGTVAGSAPIRPTTAASASLVSVPTSCPAAAYL